MPVVNNSKQSDTVLWNLRGKELKILSDLSDVVVLCF